MIPLLSGFLAILCYCSVAYDGEQDGSGELQDYESARLRAQPYYEQSVSPAVDV